MQKNYAHERCINAGVSRTIAVVTGAGRGIGAAIATTLAGLGAHVVLCGRTHAPLEATSSAIDRSGGKAARSRVDGSGYDRESV